MRKTQTAPRIQQQTKGKLLTCSFRIDHETENQLQAYAEFIHSGRSYVIREALKYLFRKDRSFQSQLRDRNSE
jgi:predicted transcriptional regulator